MTGVGSQACGSCVSGRGCDHDWQWRQSTEGTGQWGPGRSAATVMHVTSMMPCRKQGHFHFPSPSVSTRAPSPIFTALISPSSFSASLLTSSFPQVLPCSPYFNVLSTIDAIDLSLLPLLQQTFNGSLRQSGIQMFLRCTSIYKNNKQVHFKTCICQITYRWFEENIWIIVITTRSRSRTT